MSLLSPRGCSPIDTESPLTGRSTSRSISEDPHADYLNSDSKRCFGVPLSLYFTKHASLPPVVDDTISALRNHLHLEGLFRISGTFVEIMKYKTKYDEGQTVDFSDVNPHDISGLLKQYLRELPEPLLTYALYDNFLHCASALHYSSDSRPLQNALAQVPSEHVQLMHRVLTFLGEAGARAAQNKMPPHNLATVFGPNFLRCDTDDPMKIVQDSPAVTAITNILINSVDSLFVTRSDGTIAVAGEDDEDTQGFVEVHTDPTADGDIVGYVRVAYDYTAQNEYELTLAGGDIVAVIHKDESGWWKGKLRGHIGLFPVTFCEDVKGGDVPQEGGSELAHVVANQRAEEVRLLQQKLRREIIDRRRLEARFREFRDVMCSLPGFDSLMDRLTPDVPEIPSLSTDDVAATTGAPTTAPTPPAGSSADLKTQVRELQDEVNGLKEVVGHLLSRLA